MIKTTIEFDKYGTQYYRKFIVQTFAGFSGMYTTVVHEYHQLIEYNQHMNKWQFACKPPLILTEEFKQTHSDLVGHNPKDVRIMVGQRHLAACLEILNEDSLYHNTI
jgi:hypothetical protein